MQIPRSQCQSPSLIDVIVSKFPEGGKATSSDVVGYRGSEPTTKISDLPSGRVITLAKGFVFLSSGEKFIHSARKDGLVDSIAGVAGQFANAAVPFGGLLTGLGLGAIGALFGLAGDKSAIIREQLLNPDTFIVPYLDVIECENMKVGSIWTRRYYVVVKTKTFEGLEESYCMCLLGNYEWTGKYLCSQIWSLRIYQEELVAMSEIYNQIGVIDEVNRAEREMLEDYERKGKTPTPVEVQDRRVLAKNNFLASTNMTEEDVAGLMWAKLDHFRPLFDKKANLHGFDSIAKEFFKYRGND